MDLLSDFEQAVLDKLLSGEDPTLGELRRQAAALRVVERELTGVGFFVFVAVEAGIPAAKGEKDFAIADVHGDLEGLEHGAGFVVFVRKGYLADLEGFSFDEPWPSHLGTYRLSFDQEPRDLRLPG